MFITFEGSEGAGKTTQINLLKEHFINKGLDVVTTRQPGGTELGQNIRKLILDPEQNDKPSPLAELFLYMADRGHNVETIIKPALEQGKIVICDRYIDSTIAYQGFGRKIDIQKLDLLNEVATQGLKPEVTFVLDLPVEDGLKRVVKRDKKLDRIESEKMEFHQKVREGFLYLAQKEPERVKVINAIDTPEKISSDIISHIENLRRQ
ncbi:MAG: dTMP kinase [Candidatus Sericytochromatia bacterium]